MIRKLSIADQDAIYDIINRAACAYQGAIPDDCYHQPYMPREELQREIKRMTFVGWVEKGRILGVMGLEPVRDVTLIRHAYVLPAHQRQSIGDKLLTQLMKMTRTRRLLVGTWAANSWGIAFYRKHGFKLLPDKDDLLKKYWDISQRQIETSVVLGVEL